MAGEFAHGTGWVIVDNDGLNYLVTNRHVVIGAEKVNVYQESQDGTRRAFMDCPILYVDSQMDLAICQFPGAQKLFRAGFPLDTRVEKDLTEVVAAGFPGFGGKPLWQVSVGTITNSQARIDPAYSYLIQHSAPIDPGNSDSPVAQDVNQHISYAIVGEKGWQAYSAVLDAEGDQKQFVEWFLEDPVEAMRTSVYWLFSAEVDREAGTVVEFQGINPADEDKIGKPDGTRTTFTIGGKPKEIVWTREYGQWRISDMSLALARPAAAAAPSSAVSSPASAAPGAPAVQPYFPVHSVLGGFGLAGTGAYFGIEYAGMIFSGPVGLSAAVGYAVDGSVFVIGGPVLAPWIDLLFPLRIGVAATPLGTSIIFNPGALLKLGALALALDFGYVVPDVMLFGVGLGVNF